MEKGRIYVALMYNNTESFIKVGYTSKTAKHRLSYIKEYKHRIIREFKSCNALSIEEGLHKKNKFRRYYPKIKFSGITECYYVKDQSKIITTIKSLIHRKNPKKAVYRNGDFKEVSKKTDKGFDLNNLFVEPKYDSYDFIT